MNKPGIPQGFRDFDAETLKKRQFILNGIKSVFELHGFTALETPAMENLETLTGKYGEEGDKLIFKVLNNGLSDPKNADKARQGFDKVLDGKSSNLLTERALKYDLTIPFARYVAMNRGLLTFPYKRYQIQNVWRADRPQKGRYREFTQCDADVVGSTSLWNEIDLVSIYHEALTNIGLPDYQLCINNRKLLVALANKMEVTDKFTDLTVAIDKLDKSSRENVLSGLAEKGFTKKSLEVLHDFLEIKGGNQEKLTALNSFFDRDATALMGIKELDVVVTESQKANLIIDLSLARGLNYYTGCILEVKPPAQVKIGSIGGGGRYDDLTGLFGVKDVPGVGISFGIDRIYDVLTELDRFPGFANEQNGILFFYTAPERLPLINNLMQALRAAGIACELYDKADKFEKQFKYAEKKHIKYAGILGDEEFNKEEISIKALEAGKQVTIPYATLINWLLMQDN